MKNLCHIECINDLLSVTRTCCAQIASPFWAPVVKGSHKYEKCPYQSCNANSPCIIRLIQRCSAPAAIAMKRVWETARAARRGWRRVSRARSSPVWNIFLLLWVARHGRDAGCCLLVFTIRLGWPRRSAGHVIPCRRKALQPEEFPSVARIKSGLVQ